MCNPFQIYLLGMRDNSDVIQEVFILTDGKSKCGGGAAAAALKLQSTVTVYALVIGDHTVMGSHNSVLMFGYV